jgi:hypothetical protein
MGSGQWEYSGVEGATAVLGIRDWGIGDWKYWNSKDLKIQRIQWCGGIF